MFVILSAAKDLFFHAPRTSHVVWLRSGTQVNLELAAKG